MHKCNQELIAYLLYLGITLTRPLLPMQSDWEPLWSKKWDNLVCLLHVYSLEPITSCSSSLRISVPQFGKLCHIQYAFCWAIRCRNCAELWIISLSSAMEVPVNMTAVWSSSSSWSSGSSPSSLLPLVTAGTFLMISTSVRSSLVSVLSSAVAYCSNGMLICSALWMLSQRFWSGAG